MDVENEHTSTNILFRDDAKDALLKGASTVAEAVGCTMGPRGRTVLIQQEGKAPILTKDGVTVSKAVRLKDPIARMGGDLLRDAASRTNEVAGDGTTTATVISYALMREGHKLLSAGHNPLELVRDLELAKNAATMMLKTAAHPVKDTDTLRTVATISANGDEAIGGFIADALNKVGRDGIVTVEDAKGTTTSLDVVEGTQFERGYLSPYFVTNNDKMVAIYDGCDVLVTDRRLGSITELIPVLENCRSGRPLLIIADDVEPEALQALVLNRVKNRLRVVAVKAPGIGQAKGHMLDDIATLVGGTVVSAKRGIELKDAVAHLGHTRKAIVNAKATTLVGTEKTSEALVGRIKELRSQLEDPTLDSDEEAILKLRLARLTGSVAVIKVGGATELEISERRYRIEDALNATRAAVEEGFVPGGGIALYNVVQELGQVTDGSTQLMIAGCLEPLRRIAENAGMSFDVVSHLISSTRSGILDAEIGIDDYGWDARKKEVRKFTDIIDPVKVTRTALENAVSVAIAFLSLGAAVYEEE